VYVVFRHQFYIVKGFSEAMKGLLKLGVIDPNSHPWLHPDGPAITWVSIIFGNNFMIFYDIYLDC